MKPAAGNTEYALITGGSQGLGLALAHELAQQGYNLLIVALPGRELDAGLEALRARHTVSVEGFGVDLTAPEGPQQVWDWVQEEGFPVSVLVNNAGLGHKGDFDYFGNDFYHTLLQLNVVAVVKMTRLFLPELKRHPRAHILNVGSTASYFDIPFKAVYSASKKFIYGFSRSLRHELRHTRIRVTATCPAAIATRDDVRETAKNMGFFGQFGMYTPQNVAQSSISGMLAGRAVVLPGSFNALVIRLSRLLPQSLRVRLAGKRFGNKNLPCFPVQKAAAPVQKEVTVVAK